MNHSIEFRTPVWKPLPKQVSGFFLILFLLILIIDCQNTSNTATVDEKDNHLTSRMSTAELQSEASQDDLESSAAGENESETVDGMNEENDLVGDAESNSIESESGSFDEEDANLAQPLMDNYMTSLGFSIEPQETFTYKMDETSHKVALLSVRANNTLDMHRWPDRFHPAYLLDDDENTVWAGDLTEQNPLKIYLELDQPVAIDGIKIRNGASWGDKDIYNYARPQTLKISTPTDSTSVLLRDCPNEQMIQIKPVAGKNIVLTIQSFYPNKDTAKLFLGDIVFYNENHPVQWLNLESKLKALRQQQNRRSLRIKNLVLNKVFYRKNSEYMDPGVYNFFYPSNYNFHSGTDKKFGPHYNENGYFRVFPLDNNQWLFEFHFHAKQFSGYSLSYWYGVRETILSWKNNVFHIEKDDLWVKDYQGLYTLNHPPYKEPPEAEKSDKTDQKTDAKKDPLLDFTNTKPQEHFWNYFN